MYIVLTLASIVISTVYTICFVYYNWFLIKNKDIFTKYNTGRFNTGKYNTGKFNI